jgi:hypothetical protein
MANGTGTAELDFGAGSNSASVAVTGLTAITALSKAEAWVMGDDTSADHTAEDHRFFPVFAALTCGTPTASTGFTIYGRSSQQMTGKWTVRYVWSE